MSWPKRMRGRRIFWATAVAIAAVWVGVWWGSSSPKSLDEAQPLATRPVETFHDVYLLGRSFPSAAYAVTTSEGLVLIDSGVEDNAATVIGQLQELGLDVDSLRAILLTHVHGDHSLGAAGLRQRTGAKTYAGRGDCKALRAGGPPEAFVSTFYMPEANVHATVVDEELAGGETLEFGDARFRVINASGHTPGSMCYLLERPGLRALFTGDIVLCLDPERRNGPGVLGSLGTYATYLAPRYRGNARDFLATLRRLRELSVPDLVLPGHPRMDQIAQLPQLTAERWQGLLDEGIEEMTQLLSRYEMDGANFLDGNRKELLPGLHYLGDLEGAAVYCLSTPRGRFVFDAPGGASLVEFLAARFAELGWQSRKLTAVLLTSVEPRATAGLHALVKATGCSVVAPGEGMDAIRRICPRDTAIVPAQEIEKTGLTEARAISLRRRGLAPLAYELRWARKVVVVSGRIPAKLSAPTVVPTVLQELRSEIADDDGRRADYFASLAELGRLKPDVWLPAIPLCGQNANLYDREWALVLTENRRLLESAYHLLDGPSH